MPRVHSPSSGRRRTRNRTKDADLSSDEDEQNVSQDKTSAGESDLSNTSILSDSDTSFRDCHPRHYNLDDSSSSRSYGSPSLSTSSLYPETRLLEEEAKKYGFQVGERPKSLSPESRGLRTRNQKEDRYSSMSHDPKKQLYPDLSKIDRHDDVKQKTARLDVNSDSGSAPIFVGLGIIVFLFILWWLISSPTPTPDNKSTTPPFDKFVTYINQLEQNLPGQEKRLWKTVKASVMHVLREDHSDYPVVLLVASQTPYASLTSCIANEITAAYESSLGLEAKLSTTNVNQLKHLDSAGQKKKLDEALHSAFFSHQRKSFIIENLQSLSPEAALLLHGYCDNDNAPYKDVMIVLTLYEEETVVKFGNSDTVENYLESLWNAGLDTDKVKAIMSRIANNIVVVGQEDQSTVGRICH